MTEPRTDVLLVIRSLNRGGAERQLAQLAAGLGGRGHRVAVVTFYAEGPLRAELDAAGVPLFDLAKRSRWDLGGPFVRLVRLLRRERPRIVYGFLTEGNLVALAAKLCVVPRPCVVWGLRASNTDLHAYSWFPRATSWSAARLARFADLVIANSSAGSEHHIRLGYPGSRMIVIENGIDTDVFRPVEERQVTFFDDAPDAPLVALPARLDPVKDHLTFLRAASVLAGRDPTVRFVCVGDGISAYAAELREVASALGLDGRLGWIGERDDMPAVLASVDVCCLTSAWGEGFPNVVAEAMACGVPVAVTDVGDAALVVGDLGEVVPTSSPDELADALARLLERRRCDPQLSLVVRRRVVECFSLERMVARTEDALGLRR